MDLALDGVPAAVAGASRGLGYAVAMELAREGARVAICARRRESLEAEEAVTELLGSLTGSAVAAYFNLETCVSVISIFGDQPFPKKIPGAQVLNESAPIELEPVPPISTPTPTETIASCASFFRS